VTSPTLTKRVDRLLAEVHLPVPFDVHEFCRLLAATRHRPMHLKAVDTETAGLPSGIVFATDDVDVVLYDATTTGYHQMVIILHEVGHLVAGHYPGRLLGGDAATQLLPEIGPHQARRVAARDGYTSEEEREAEYFARRVLELVSRRAASTPSADALLLERVGNTFEQ